MGLNAALYATTFVDTINVRTPTGSVDGNQVPTFGAWSAVRCRVEINRSTNRSGGGDQLAVGYRIKAVNRIEDDAEVIVPPYAVADPLATPPSSAALASVLTIRNAVWGNGLGVLDHWEMTAG